MRFTAERQLRYVRSKGVRRRRRVRCGHPEEDNPPQASIRQGTQRRSATSARSTELQRSGPALELKRQ